MNIQNLVKSKPTNTLLKADDLSILQQHKELLIYPEETINSILVPKDIKIPDEFNGKEVWKSFLSDVLNQRECGSCWAFASVSSLSDRYNILSKGKQPRITLSPVPLLICDTFGYKLPSPIDYPELTIKIRSNVISPFGCNGNTLAEAWRYLYTLGTSTIECLPVSLIQSEYLPSCIDILSPTYDLCKGIFSNYYQQKKYSEKIKHYSSFYVYSLKNDQLNICKDIYTWGPVSTCMEVYENFYTFNPKTEIYKWDKKGELISGHSVVLTGWGIENGIPFWWVRNSWGPEWGIDGYFKIIRGTNECKIEEHVIAGLPNMTFDKPYELNLLDDNLKDFKHKYHHYSQNSSAGGVYGKVGYTRRLLSYQDFLDNLNLDNFSYPKVERNVLAGEIISKNSKDMNGTTIMVVIITIMVIITIIVVIMSLKSLRLFNLK
jgi:hypothetical protein